MTQNKITKEQTQRAYLLAKKVVDGDMLLADAKTILSESYGMNRNSAGDYINNYKMMRKGECYTHTMNPYATEHFLEKIRDDLGDVFFKNALDSLEKHLKYYGSLSNGSQQKAHQSILERFKLELSDRFYPEEVFIPDEADVPTIYKEGACKKITVNAYERCGNARRACIKEYGAICSVCKFDFFRVYGDIGNNFIHVHHLIEISSIKAEYKINPIEDLRPVCPNCHAMLHREKPAMSIDKLIKIMETRGGR